MFLTKKLLCSIARLPTLKPVPSSYTETQVAAANGATNTIYTVPETGYYRVEVMAAGGQSPYKGTGGRGGKTSQIVYLYKDSKCLLWGAGIPTTGYPAPTSDLGGIGARGSGRESGGGGGGSAASGTLHYCYGGGGAGFLAGTDRDVLYVTHKEDPWIFYISSGQDWIAGGYVVKSLYCYVLAGGGGGGSSDEGSDRAGGAGGGAWGNGGDTYGPVDRTSGPGRTWGQGNSAGHYSAGADGAWAVLDFSRNRWTWGIGGGSIATNGYCRLYKLNY